MNLPGRGQRQEGAGAPGCAGGCPWQHVAIFSQPVTLCMLTAVAVDSIKDDTNFICLEPYT